MPGVNENLADKTLTHALTLARLSAHEENEVLKQLRRLERDLVRDLTRTTLTPFRQDRYQRLLKQTTATIRRHYKTIRDTQAEQMEEVARLEGTWTVRSMNAAIAEPIGINISLASVSWTSQQVKAIARNATVENKVSGEWWSRQAADTRIRFSDTVKQGLLRGENTETIIRAVRHEVMPVSHHQAEALVRSSISAVSHDARRETYKQNQDLIRGVQHLSTLDNRTSEICMVYDHKMWDTERQPIGHDLPYKDGVPRHFNCRSTEVAVLKSWSELAGRTLPDFDETLDQRFRQKLREMGMSEEDIVSAQRRTRASMDGQVSRDISFAEFLQSKGTAFQDEVLGKGKAELYRAGKVTGLSQLLDFRGNPLTLKQLRGQ